MLPYKIFPPFEIGPFHINMYGVMFASGALLAYYIASRMAQKKGISDKIISELFIYSVASGLIGARLLFVALNLNYFLQYPLDALKIWEGGLAFFGGLLAATAAGYLYAKMKGLSFFLFADLIAIPLVTGHIFGRMGDYLTGGHPGSVADLPWSIFLDGAARHPVVLYEIIGLSIILGVLFFIQKRVRAGELFLTYLMLYSVQRFALDFFRSEASFGGLRSAQFITLILFAVALATLVFRRRRTMAQ